MQRPVIDDQLHWYKDAVIYEVHIKAFRDSNGDGTGDIIGLIEKLDYLQALGVTAIWVLPFYPSPLRDDGYDIADYYSINPRYGSIDDFHKLLEEAHKRNMKVITELVINHTSDQHPWFQAARRAPAGSPERAYYVWTDDPQQYKDARIIFQDYEPSNWTWDPVAGQYYWHRFFHHQPDLNYDNPAVQAEVFKIIDHWCSMGVDGFRLDAIPYMFERDGTNCENLPETHEYLKKLRAHVDEHYPGTLLLAEANMWPEDSASYFGDGDECQMNYHFPVMPRMFMALQMEDRHPITDIFDQTPAIPETCQWAIFLRNHDELTLEMVTDEERDYMYKVYVKDPKARINLGIRHRLGPLMGNDRRKIELLNYLLFSLPGTPVLYYGDEIGMGDNFYLGDRDGVRTPMQWNSGRNAGFSEVNPQQLYLPVILDPQYHYEAVNVELQISNTSSLLWSMRRLIAVRKKYKAFGRGDMQFINSENPKILAFTRTYENEIILVVVNLSRSMQPAELDLEKYSGSSVVDVFSNNVFPSVKNDGNYLFTLSQYECQWFLLKQPQGAAGSNKDMPVVKMKKWEELTSPGMRQYLATDVVPAYLQKTRWFGGKARRVQALSITDAISVPLKSSVVTILLIEVQYDSDLPELYQLPVAFATDDKATAFKDHPLAQIAPMQLGGESGVLYDAMYDAGYQMAILDNMTDNNKIAGANRESINFTGNKPLRSYLKEKEKIVSKILAAEQSNTSVVYDNAFFLKIFRKVDVSINPDVEITRFLTRETTFRHIPAYIGSIEWQTVKGTIVLGMMQEMVDSNTDGWTYMLDRLDTYNEKALAAGNVADTTYETTAGFLAPAGYDDLSAAQKELYELTVAERVKLLGQRTAELHHALASGHSDPSFAPEAFSLHYQRSLFSSFQTLVRKTFQSLAANLAGLPDDIRAEAEEILSMKKDILDRLKGIYRKKINAEKIRIHGDYHLGQTLFTGKDIVILDFEGEPSRSYSERRLKRSPLRDVAGMLRSFHYAAYGSMMLNRSYSRPEVAMLTKYTELWYKITSGIFMEAYLEHANKGVFMPDNKEDLATLLQTYLLEKAIYELYYELNNRPDWVFIPIRGIKAIMG